jgi:hypothetical protein
VIGTLPNACIAQCDTCKPDCNTSIRALPKMWVSKESADKRKKQLMYAKQGDTSKYDRLKPTLYKESPTFFLSRDNLAFLLNKVKTISGSEGLRIYFAIFQKKGSNQNIHLPDGKLILLFTAAKPLRDCGNTFLIDTNGTIFTAGHMKSTYINKYIKDVLPSLTRTVDHNDSSNYYSAMLSDTRSIFYKKDRILQALDTEIIKTRIDLDKLAITISAYDTNGKKPTSYDGYTYKNRMILQFDYIRKDETTFYFEDLPSFCCRKCKLNEDESLKALIIDSEKALDNGHLCPANCPVP